MNDTDVSQYLDDIIHLHRDVHGRFREAIGGLGREAINWTPGPGANSIGTVVTHALGAEAEMLRNLLRIPTERDRESEFTSEDHDLSTLLGLLDAADRDWEELAPRLGEEELRTAIPRPNKPEPQSGLYWLVRNYGHVREHIGHVELTRQLYENRLRS